MINSEECVFLCLPVNSARILLTGFPGAGITLVCLSGKSLQEAATCTTELKLAAGQISAKRPFEDNNRETPVISSVRLKV